ncbi:DeoR/GlpR family DNA-binding transcription regulator [Pseudalkalibacillus berkeleyi]|uniref:DeoR/GlpR family DNA-binding transcription regulator n=1 Tax=Pseudalkalibacillus berkeleyi TaxID=1069813 RepID=A0ABS9GXE5_9BACL|nr:DeoR/GlpR family DNA-binding transcription regulator [Pseudalkalibacillus berkeleyi]MCF6137364.1 DeoR/GlpR family DNA-binding transcription regulator [Pseudalkalibacillus berkeleyi]
MFQDERLLQVKEYLHKHKRISVTQLMALYEVSRDTARRDLVKLEEQGDVLRTRGGAKLLESSPVTSSKREQEHELPSRSMRAIANSAQTLIRDNDYILLDESITVRYLCEVISSLQLKAITNSLTHASILSKHEGIQISVLGGILDKSNHCLIGSAIHEHLRQYFVDKVFIGAEGITNEGISYSNEESAMVHKTMSQRGAQVIVLADDEAFGKKSLVKSLNLPEVDTVITNKNPGKEYEDLFKQTHIKLLVAEEGEDNG